jgi:Tol biopolymer transport system component
MPDGRSLVASALDQKLSAGLQGFQIWKVTYPEGKARKITKGLNSYREPSLTGDGNCLSVLQQTVTCNLWVAPGGDLAHARQITTAGVEEAGSNGLAWTADRRIVYWALKSPSLWTIDSGGGHANPVILASKNARDREPSVCRSSGQLVFSSDRGGETAIWRADADGSHLKQLTSGSADDSPSCSPDGQSVVYSSVSGGASAVWKVSIDGGKPVQLFQHGLSPDISPDGKWIAVNYLEEGRKARMAVFPFAGGKPYQLFEFARGTCTLPRWTPDGQGHSFIVTENEVSNLWVQPLDGGHAKPLTDFKSDLVFSFAWSPDGDLALSRGTISADVVLIKSMP